MNKDTGEFLQGGTINISFCLKIAPKFTRDTTVHFESVSEVQEIVQRIAKEIVSTQRIFQEEITKSVEEKHDN